MEFLGQFEGILKALAAVSGAVVTLIGVFRWTRPLTVSPGVTISFDPTKNDEVFATIVNRTRAAQYVVSCVACGVHPWRIVVARFIRRPVLRVRLWPLLRYTGTVYEMLPSSPLKLEPQQPATVKAHVSEHPPGRFRSSLLQVEVTLSTGKKVRSHGLTIPKRWQHAVRALPT